MFRPQALISGDKFHDSCLLLAYYVGASSQKYLDAWM